MGNILEDIIKRLEKVEHRVQGVEEILEIEDSYEDIYSTELEAEDAYPDCDCDETCEDCEDEDQ